MAHCRGMGHHCGAVRGGGWLPILPVVRNRCGAEGIPTMSDRSRRGVPPEPGRGLCAHTCIHGCCSACGESVALHYPTTALGGFCGQCCPVCVVPLAVMPAATKGLKDGL